MISVRLLLLSASEINDDDISFIKRYLAKQNYFNKALHFIMLIIFGASVLLWLFGWGIEVSPLIISKLNLNLSDKASKVFNIVLFWTIPLLWGFIGMIFQRLLEKRKRNLSRLSEKFSEKFNYNFRIPFKE